MAPKGEVNKHPDVYVWDSPGFNTGFLPITPSPETISVLFKAS